MRGTAASRKRSTFSSRCSVRQMDSHRSSTTTSNDTGISLQDLVRGERARALEAQLASWHPECSAAEIEDAIQTACRRFLEHAEGISAPGQVYSWIRTTAHRELNRETARHARELMVEPSAVCLEEAVSEDADPAEEMISNEDDVELATLVEEVNTSLPDRRREVLALYGAGYKRPEIAERLGLREWVVKRDLVEIMDAARAAVARLAGGGCQHGEPLVLRSACGLATSAEESQVREHLAHCRRCEVFCERLIAWREKAGAMLPVPAAEEASPGLVERALHKSSDALSSLKQHIVDGGVQAKQQAAASSYRTVDPTPFTAARPGTVASILTGCVLAVGGGATYCVEQGVDPLGAAKGLIASTPETKPEETTPPESEVPAPVYTPEPPAAEEPDPTPEPAPPPASSAPEPKPDLKPAPEPTAEDSFEPDSAYASSEGGTEETYEAPEAAPVESSEPAPAPAQPGSQFGGP
jgi:RNA polymerase sigma factor (sigma-70 family)